MILLRFCRSAVFRVSNYLFIGDALLRRGVEQRIALRPTHPVAQRAPSSPPARTQSSPPASTQAAVLHYCVIPISSGEWRLVTAHSCRPRYPRRRLRVTGRHLEPRHHRHRTREGRAALLRPASHASALPHPKEQPAAAVGPVQSAVQGVRRTLSQQGAGKREWLTVRVYGVTATYSLIEWAGICEYLSTCEFHACLRKLGFFFQYIHNND